MSDVNQSSNALAAAALHACGGPRGAAAAGGAPPPARSGRRARWALAGRLGPHPHRPRPLCGREPRRARREHPHTPQPRGPASSGGGCWGAKNRKERRKKLRGKKKRNRDLPPKTWSCNTTHGKNWVLATHASRHAKHAPTGYCPANAIAGISRCDHFLAASSPPSEKGRPSSAWRGRARLGVSRQYGAEPAAARCQVAG